MTLEQAARSALFNGSFIAISGTSRSPPDQSFRVRSVSTRRMASGAIVGLQLSGKSHIGKVHRRHHHLHEMFPPVIDKRYFLPLLRDPIQRDGRCPSFSCASLPDSYMVHGFTKAVVHGEAIPFGGEAGRKRELVRLSVRPRSDSTIRRYIHAADPVYHVHPPLPVCGGTA